MFHLRDKQVPDASLTRQTCFGCFTYETDKFQMLHLRERQVSDASLTRQTGFGCFICEKNKFRILHLQDKRTRRLIIAKETWALLLSPYLFASVSMHRYLLNLRETTYTTHKIPFATAARTLAIEYDGRGWRRTVGRWSRNNEPLTTSHRRCRQLYGIRF